MRHAIRPDFSIFEITGGAPPRPGEPLFLRVSARLHDTHKSQAVAVVAAIDGNGRPLPLRVSGQSPALVETTAASGLTLELDAPRPATLTPAPSPGPSERARPHTFDPPAPTRVGDHLLDVLPMGGDLVGGLPNRVFLRLRDASLRPVPDTRLTVTHSALTNGQVTVETDRDGLAELTLLADRPNLDLEVATPGGTATSALRPLGRELTLLVPPQAPPGGRLTVKVATLRTQGLLSCELLHDTERGREWVHALDHPIAHRDFELELPLPELAAGTRLDLQCALVPGVGLAWASRPVWLGAPDDSLSAALSQTLEAHPREPPRVLLKTRDTDRATFEAAHNETRSLLLIALASVLASLLLFALSRVVLHVRKTRALIHEALADDLSLTPNERHDIARTRGVFYLLIGLALALGWIAAVAALLT